jgi:uncharacterized membrane protein
VTTHELTKPAAFVTPGGFLFPDFAVIFLAVPVTVVAVFATAYSYRDYRRRASEA